MKKLVQFFREFILALLIAALLLGAMVLVGYLIYPDAFTCIYDNLMPAKQPEYAETHKGCYYYPLDSIPDCFEYYTGYTPDMTFDEKTGEVTILLANGHTVNTTVNEYAPNMWALEVPADVDLDFSKYGIFSYKCFDRNIEMQWKSEGRLGIYYDLETAERCFQEVTGASDVTFTLSENSNGNGYYIATSDTDANITLKYENVDYYIDPSDGAFCFSGRLLSQLIYDWELENQKNVNLISLGSLF